MEERICISNRKELVLINPLKVAYVEADGNYVHVICLHNQRFHLNYSVSDFQKILMDSGCGRFIKIGRSLIVNIQFVTHVYPKKNILFLSDGETWSRQLEIPQKTLKKLCVLIDGLFSSDNKQDSPNG